MNLDLRFYLQRFWRRFPWFVIIMAVVSAIGITLSVVLPPVYRAQAQLLVESPSIPTDLAASTVATGAPEALQIIQQRLLARANLLDLAQRLSVYDGQSLMTPDKIVEDMRRRPTIGLPVAKAAADFVTVSFAAPTAQLSAQVTNDLVTQILQENVSLRTETAGETMDFFQQEVDRLGTELGQMGSKIMVYKSARKDALPDSLDFRRTRQAQQQERLLQLEREMSALKERRDRLTEIYQATGNVGQPAAPTTPEEAQLRDARNQLNNAMTLYSPQHPTVVALKARVAALEGVVNAQAGAVPDAGTAGEPRPSDASIAFKLQMADIDGQISFDADQKAQIETELVALKATIEATPGNAIELDALQRDYDNAQIQYNNAVARLGAAQTGDRIEALSKGQRITVIEQAVVPNAPASPNRQLIAIGSVLGGLALGLAFVFLIEVMNRAVHRPADLVSKLGIQALATVPYIYTRGEVFRRRMMVVSVVLVAVLGIPAALFAVHQYYLPLDLLIGRVLDRI